MLAQAKPVRVVSTKCIVVPVAHSGGVKNTTRQFSVLSCDGMLSRFSAFLYAFSFADVYDYCVDSPSATHH